MAGDWIPIDLTDDQIAVAKRIAQARFDRGQQRQRRLRGQNRSYADDLWGALGEQAAAVYFGQELLDVPMSVERRRGYDIAGRSVRATRYRTGGLRLNVDERCGKFVLAVLCDYPRRVWLAGEIRAEDARPVGVLRRDKGREPWIRVDAELLDQL